jgi:hypothetical protein
MALTTYLISQASDHLSDKSVQLWLVLIRKSPKYRQNALIYSADIEQRITATEGTVKARMLNALMMQIDDLGVGQVQIRGDREGTWWSQDDERTALVEEALDLLYDDISTMVVPPNPLNSSIVAATGRRKVNTGFCYYCNCSYENIGGRRTCRC